MQWLCAGPKLPNRSRSCKCYPYTNIEVVNSPIMQSSATGGRLVTGGTQPEDRCYCCRAPHRFRFRCLPPSTNDMVRLSASGLYRTYACIAAMRHKLSTATAGCVWRRSVRHPHRLLHGACSYCSGRCRTYKYVCPGRTPFAQHS